MSSTSSISNTGTVVTTGTTTYISSTASGLDTSSLITAAVAQKTAVADSLDAEVTTNKNKIAAYSDVQTLVNALSSSVDALTSSLNLSSGTSSAFGDMQASVSSSSSAQDASSVLSASADSTAVAGSYSIAVNQLATSMKVASAASSQSTAIGDTGAFTLQADDGTAVTINVTSGMTLSDLATAINDQSSTSGVDATLIQVSSGSYKLVLTSADTGQAITATASSGDDVLSDIGLTGSDGSFSNVLQQAQDASITIDGETVTSTTNTITNALTGVDLDLEGTTSGATITLTVGQDTSEIADAVSNFVTAYNDLHEYIAAQETVDSDGTVSSTSYLFADGALRSLSNALNSLVTDSSGSASGSGAIGYLSQLGVSFDSSNELELDDTTLSTALQSTSAVQSFFQSTYSASQSGLVLIHNDTTSSLSFTLDITAGASGITGATVNGQSGLFTVSGNELIGVAGTPYAGLTLAMTTTSNTSVSVSLQQGFADAVVNFASQYGDTGSGVLEQQISSLVTTDTSLSAQSSTIRAYASTYETSLINKYADMETEMSSAQIVQQEIEALLNGSSSSS